MLKFNKNYIIPSVLVLVAILVSFVVTRETFDPNYSSEKEVYIQTKQTKSSYPLAISSGDIQKYKTDGGYIYLMKFNLPDTNAPFQTYDLDLPFNQLTPYVPYEVYTGSVKLGELKRNGDGWYQMELQSKENYTDFKVKLGDSLVGEATF